MRRRYLPVGFGSVFRAFLILLSGGWITCRLPAQETVVPLLPLTQVWRYNQTTSYDGVPWTLPRFDDSLLPQGAGLLGVETNNPFVTSRLQTRLTLGRSSYYFRTSFQFNHSPQGVSLVFTNILDDGAVFYLNGYEIKRLFMPAAPSRIEYVTRATSHEATGFDVFRLSGPIVETNLFRGTNVLAVEAHQAIPTSSDVVFGASLSALVPDRGPPATLRMPLAPPTKDYRLVNAFGDLSVSDPVAITSPPGETNRLFVVEQAGRIIVITNLASPNRTVFLDISARIRSGGEEGLLGLAFHPGYDTNRQFFLFYTVNATTSQGSNTAHDRLSRMQASVSNPNRAETTGEVILFEQYDQAGNHNGGDIHFGPDGYLYVALGDEGGGDDQFLNGQRIDRDFFSGILRIDVDLRPENLLPNPHPANRKSAGAAINYRIPTDNPWVGAKRFNGAAVSPSAVRSEFYAVGLRNPWRFSFDPLTGELYVGDVGQNAYEEVDLVRKGGNYGWSHREGDHDGPLSNPPVGVSFDPPIVEYLHGGAENQGSSITGGRVYRGAGLPELRGSYVFADYVSGNVWALRAQGTNRVPFVRLTGDGSIAGFGVDPRNGDLLTADQGEDTLKRLVNDPDGGGVSLLPPTLFHTGAFTNLTDLADATTPLTANAGVHGYEVNTPFWSDNAQKSRWVFRSNTNLLLRFSETGSWSFPTGTVWVKHFDLELTNGVPESSKRVETRLLVKNESGVYGVTYRWGDSLTNALLVPEAGLDEPLLIQDGGLVRTQVWHYPSRSECLTCHTPAAGYALGFTTAQLNRDLASPSGTRNQIALLQQAGYFDAAIPDLNLLPRLAAATNALWSLEWRVRSYLDANCSACHRPGGTALGHWDARHHIPLSESGLILGSLVNSGGSPDNRVVVPGSQAHSMLLQRISNRGQGQMPPLASTLVDNSGMELLKEWITESLPETVSFAQWQTLHFQTQSSPPAGGGDDPDQDGQSNLFEWLTDTDPLASSDRWELKVVPRETGVRIRFVQPANCWVRVESTADLLDPQGWRPLDVRSNAFVVPAYSRVRDVLDDFDGGTVRFYRVVIGQP